MNFSFAMINHRFRMSRQIFQILLNHIGPYIAPIAYTNHTLSENERLLIALRFFGSNSPMWQIGDAEHVSKATSYRCVDAVVDACLSNLHTISWPSSEIEGRKLAADFFNCSRGVGNLQPGSWNL